MALTPETWRDVFDATENPVFLHEVQFRVLLTNRADCHEAGMATAEAAGTGPSHFAGGTR